MGAYRRGARGRRCRGHPLHTLRRTDSPVAPIPPRAEIHTRGAAGCVEMARDAQRPYRGVCPVGAGLGSTRGSGGVREADPTARRYH